MWIELIMTGDELMDGRVVNRNASDIAQALNEWGFEVREKTTIGDPPDHLRTIFKTVSQRAKVAILTGGLGPTDDDRTVGILAELAEAPLVLDQEVVDKIQAFFDSIGRPMAESNLKQAYVPQGAKRIDNHRGTTPGVHIEINGCHFFALPGVPREMRAMLKAYVYPQLQHLAGDDYLAPRVQQFKTFGLAESQTADLLQDLYPLPDRVDIGYRANFPEIHVRLKVTGQDAAQLDAQFDKYSAAIEQRLAQHIFTTQDDSFVDSLAALMVEHNLTLALAESCTGGLIARMVTERAGASAYFHFGAVTYSNQAKSDVLGVKEAVLEAHGAVSEAVARAMAEGARRVGKVDIAASVTGIAGPGGGTPEKPVGTVHVAVAVEGHTHHRKFHFPGSRHRVQQLTAHVTLSMIRNQVMRRLKAEQTQHFSHANK